MAMAAVSGRTARIGDGEDMLRRGIISRDDSVVVCITGNGYKTAEVVQGRLTEPVRLSRAFKDFEAWWESRHAIA